MNKVILIGNCGQDAKPINTKSALQMAVVSLATTKKFKDTNGVLQEKTQWHNVVFLGKYATNAESMIKQGMQLAIEGQLEYYEKIHDNGQKTYNSNVVVDSWKILSPKKD